MAKHRNERFRPGFAVVRIDGYDVPGIPKEQLVTVKEVWSTQEQADAEVARLNALHADETIRYFTQYAKVERGVGRSPRQATMSSTGHEAEAARCVSIEIHWHGFFRAQDRGAVDKLVGRMEALIEHPVEVLSAERYWKDKGMHDVRLRTPLEAAVLDAAILETMVLVAPLGDWMFGAPKVERDGTGSFDGTLSKSGGSRIVVAGIDLLLLEIEGPVAAERPPS